jgi:hypothetical protein
VVPIDTRLDVDSSQGNRAGLRSPTEIESLISRMDMVVTTRLHGMVLALKNGVPAVAVDPQAGGAKIMRQANEIGWPAALSVDSATDKALQDAFDYCLSAEARARARECHIHATDRIRGVRDAFISVFDGTDRLPLPASPRPPQRWLRNQWHGTKFGSFAETLQADDAQRRRRHRRFQRLRKENRRLARRARNLELQLENTKRSRSWRIVKKIGKLRAKVLRK